MAKGNNQPKKFLTLSRKQSRDNSSDMAPSKSSSVQAAASAQAAALTAAAAAAVPTINKLDVDSLRQGQLYLLRSRMVKLALFEGWNDDACLVFSVLREEANPMCWSEVKYLAGDFDAFEAFSPDGNPPIWVWKRVLGTDLPHHWFRMFEEARRRQSDWNAVYGEESTENELSNRPIVLAGTGADNDGTTSPGPDRDNLRAFIMGSPTEPGNGTVASNNHGTMENRLIHDDGLNKSTKVGKKSRKGLAGVFF